ncbi:MAG TPA: biotin carboxylase N-terminal domain-containing protein, partial [Marmoricola sp.]
MKKLLVANRGEIALRVFRTAEKMGIATVAIFTAADADAPHVRAADEAVEVVSYLDIDAVVAAAGEVAADAVHPGYGFLSERAEFARALEAAGITLVGPSADVMDQMGRKDHARAIAERAGVPVVPRGEDAAYPVLVKAAAGGGGKGMRVVHSADELDEAIAAAKREALAAFGDDTILIEKYVEHGRHIEVQIIADTHGTVLHLHERDCSSQRRHQKVIEEAPAPNLSPQVRQLVTSSAVALAGEVGYVNAGTVEFLLDTQTQEAYFLEMNTRLQVEHPVTEAITGLDLVEGQLRVAAGEPLGLTQDRIRCEGHAMEARIYAEDAFGGFLPQAGTATAVIWPEGVRVDHALESGQVVSTSYDPMLAKVIVHAADREAARKALVDALDRTAIFGLTTNTGYLRALAASPEFAAGEVDTAWLDTHELTPPDEAAPSALAGAWLADDLATRPKQAWQPDGFRLGGVRGPVIE